MPFNAEYLNFESEKNDLGRNRKENWVNNHFGHGKIKISGHSLGWLFLITISFLKNLGAYKWIFHGLVLNGVAVAALMRGGSPLTTSVTL